MELAADAPAFVEAQQSRASAAAAMAAVWMRLRHVGRHADHPMDPAVAAAGVNTRERTLIHSH